MKRNRIFLIVLILFINSLALSQIAIITNKSVTNRTLSRENVIDIYSLNSQNWSDGTKIIVTDYKGDSETKNKFYGFLDFPFAKMQKLWLKKQFSGAGMPPQSYHSAKEIIEKVISTPGAIGYIPSSLATKEVNVVLVFSN